MKRILLLILVCVILCLPGCLTTVPPSPEPFDTNIQFDKTEYFPGERITLRVELVNTSEKDYKYTGAESDFAPSATLYIDTVGGNYVIDHEPIPTTCDYNEHIIKPGERSISYFYFNIPADAEPGAARLELSFQGVLWRYKPGVEIVVDEESSFEASAGPAAVTVSSGGQTVTPIYCFGSTTMINHADGSVLEGCGAGASGYLNGIVSGSDLDSIPTLFAVGDIKADIRPDNAELLCVYVFRYENGEYHFESPDLDSVDALNDLPAGERYVALHIMQKTVNGDEEFTAYDDYLFKLVTD